MKDRDILITHLQDMESFAIMKNLQCPPIYLLGGSACILGGYLNRATTDFDFIDINYPSSSGRLFKMLEKFDMLDYFVTPIAPDFRDRAMRFDVIKHLEIYVLSREDIIISKLGRYSQKDMEDINIIIVKCNKALLLNLIEKVMTRNNISGRVKEIFLKNSKRFKEDYNV